MNKVAYVTQLIDTIDFDINYNYNGDKVSNIKYNYSVIGKLEATYNRENEEQKIYFNEYHFDIYGRVIAKRGGRWSGNYAQSGKVASGIH